MGAAHQRPPRVQDQEAVAVSRSTVDPEANLGGKVQRSHALNQSESEDIPDDGPWICGICSQRGNSGDTCTVLGDQREKRFHAPT